MGQCKEVLAFLDKSEHEKAGVATRAHILLGNNREAYDLIKEISCKIGRPEYAEVGELFIWLGEYDSARKPVIRIMIYTSLFIINALLLHIPHISPRSHH